MARADQVASIAPAARVVGLVEVPGDKSVSHRYAMLAAIASGTSTITNYASGADCRSTLGCLAALGVELTVEPAAGRGLLVRVHGRGVGGFTVPAEPLDAGNSGTTMRLLSGLLAGHAFESTLVGDASLSRRPMERVMRPLAAMGAQITAQDGRPPLVIRGGGLQGIDYTMPVASAQVKSAILLAGLHAAGDTTVTEPAASRDHTELALAAFGVPVRRQGYTLTVTRQAALRPCSLYVPGDPSSAAFFAVAAAALPGSEIEVANVGVNPTRIAWIDVLRRAGAEVEVIVESTLGSEPRGRIRVRHRALRPFTVEPDEVPLVIDELPVFAALATHGTRMVVTGARELRVKESDRIARVVDGIVRLGGRAQELEDGWVIDGDTPLLGGTVDSHGDHRLAMAFAIAGLGARRDTRIEGAEAVDVSYPGFFDDLRHLRQ